MPLYEIAVQVVPVLMVALFLDTRASHPRPGSPHRWVRLQTRVYLILCVSAFAVSLLVVTDIIPTGRATEALVIGALIGCIVLMAGQAWRRFSLPQSKGENKARGERD